MSGNCLSNLKKSSNSQTGSERFYEDSVKYLAKLKKKRDSKIVDI